MRSTPPTRRSNQLRLRQRRFTAHRKLLIIPVAAVAAVLAIALSISVASTQRTAGRVTAQPDRASRNVSRAVAHAMANPDVSRPAPPSTGCHVVYTPTSWRGGFTVNVTIKNEGTTRINGWTLTFTFPGDERISSGWNTLVTQTGARVFATNANYDATIPRGVSQSFGFLGTWRSSDTAPARFSVNGTACS
jgi:Cellulose binding domain